MSINRKPYCRKLEDGSGFGVFVPKIVRGFVDEKWEVCLGVGATKAAARQDAKKRAAVLGRN